MSVWKELSEVQCQAWAETCENYRRQIQKHHDTFRHDDYRDAMRARKPEYRELIRLVRDYFDLDPDFAIPLVREETRRIAKDVYDREAFRRSA